MTIKWQVSYIYLIWLIIVFFILRLGNLLTLPLFNDEAIYLDWGWREISTGNLFYSLFDGKPPLTMWLFGLNQYIFDNPVVAGRLISVATGLLTLLGLWQIGRRYLSDWIGLIAAGLYTISPLFVFFDRQALMESSQAAVGIWSLYWLLRLFETNNSKYAMWLGFSLGFGYLSKTTTIMFAVCLGITSLFLLTFQNKQTWRKFGFDVAFAYLVAIVVIAPMLWQKEFWRSLALAYGYSLGWHELVQFPFDLWAKNIALSQEILFWWLSPLVVIVGMYGAWLLWQHKNLWQQSLVIFWFSQIVMFWLVTRVVSVRYLAPFAPLLLLFVASGLKEGWDRLRWWGVSFGVMITLPILVLSIWQIGWPQAYLWQLNQYTRHSQYDRYVTGWTSGFGVEEALAFVVTQSQSQKTRVGVRIDSGNPESAVFAYLNDHPTLEPIYFDSRVIPVLKEKIECIKSDMPFYFVSRDSHLGGMDLFLVEVSRFWKPDHSSSIGVYKLIEHCEGKTFDLKNHG